MIPNTLHNNGALSTQLHRVKSTSLLMVACTWQGYWGMWVSCTHGQVLPSRTCELGRAYCVCAHSIVLLASLVAHRAFLWPGRGVLWLCTAWTRIASQQTVVLQLCAYSSACIYWSVAVQQKCEIKSTWWDLLIWIRCSSGPIFCK